MTLLRACGDNNKKSQINSERGRVAGTLYGTTCGDPREDVGEEVRVGVGIVECQLYARERGGLIILRNSRELDQKVLGQGLDF